MIEVRRALETDVDYIDTLQRRHSKELGFLSRTALEEYVKRFHVSIGLLNGDPACYLLGRASGSVETTSGRIYQACVQYDARHRALGTALVNHYVDTLPPSTLDVALWCAQDIEANAFWEACGFAARAWRLGKAALKRVHILWWKNLDPTAEAAPLSIPASTKAGMMRAERIVVPLEPGQTWRDVKPDSRPDLIVAAWGEQAQPKPRERKPRKPSAAKQLIVPKGIPMVLGGRVVFRQPALYTGRN